MAELDKFKRRVIRTVARMLRKEKKPEQEMWELLKNETGCDCKLLWERMRSLTLKKMKRLLIAEDKLENIIPVARMSLTDWLLFDLVLVHEDIDVIGEEMGLKMEIRPLTDLLELVEKFQIEGKQGEALVQAWTSATIAYNTDGRQCSPMLLQRRWYQLKKLSRQVFYKFWFGYRGNTKLLVNCMDLMPNKLQMNVAQKYPHLITKPFLDWEEMIDKKFVILPHEIEKNIKSKVPMSPTTKNVSGDADIVILEPSIETIDLSDDEMATISPNTDETNKTIKNPPPTEVIVKTEPVEEPDTYSKSLSELLEQRCATILESIPNIDDEVESSSKNTADNADNPCTENNDGENDVTEVDDDVNIASEIKTHAAQNKTNVEISVSSVENNVHDLTESSIDEYQKNHAIVTKLEYTEMEDELMETDNDLINDMIIMPQIANVFSNVNEQLSNIHSVVDDETTDPPVPAIETAAGDVTSDPVELVDDGDDEINYKMKAYLENTPRTQTMEAKSLDLHQGIENDGTVQQENTVSDTLEVVDESEEEINSKMEAYLDSNQRTEATEIKPIELEDSVLNKDNSQQQNIASNDQNPFLDLQVDLTFADDGIELVEDYEFEDDIIKPILEHEIKMENDLEESNEEKEDEEENAKFDLKLLMQPVVYTTKLDQMEVFKSTNIDNVSDVNVINIALNESKPINKTSLNVKEEKVESEMKTNLITNDESNQCENLSEDETSESDDEVLDVGKRVTLSSHLLQKPRSRTYNPIQLCKNPDFNTRLKRLTFGFLSSPRNLSFLKTLKPMTIDVSKSFERKLINGTMYLEESKTTQVEEKIDESTEHSTLIIPSAMSVQSLIDNAAVAKIFPTTTTGTDVTNHNNLTKQAEEDNFPQRNKVINLPDLDHIRKMNQRLFTAEITPMRFQHPNERCIPPVQLVNTPLTQTGNEAPQVNTPILKEVNKDSPVITPTPQKVNENLIEQQRVTSKPGPNKFKRPHYNYYTPCRSKPVSQVAWLNKAKETTYQDALLTIDTLNKMLNLMQGNDYSRNTIQKPKTKKKKKKKVDSQKELEKRLEKFENILKEQTPDDKTSEEQTCKDYKINEEKDATVSDSSKDSNKDPNIPVPKTKIAGACCWARHKINFPTSKKKHNCPRFCCCCCNQEYAEIRLRKKPYMNNVRNVIESVVHNTEIQNSASGSLNTPCTRKEEGKKEISIQCDIGGETIETPQENSSNIIEIDDNDDSEPTSQRTLEIDLTCKESMSPMPRISVIPSSNLVSHKKTHKTKPINVEPATADATPQSVLQLRRPVYNPPPLVVPSQPSQPRIVYHSDDDVKEKLIYLNNKQKTKRDTGCPIFLGRNKILLTDEKLPADLESTSVKVFASQQDPVVTLPAGVQMILLPDGELTCALDPTANLAPETLATLPTIMAAIKAHLTEQIQTKQQNANKQATAYPADVVNLVDDDISHETNTQLIPEHSNSDTNNISKDLNASCDLDQSNVNNLESESSNNALDSTEGDASIATNINNIIPPGSEKDENAASKISVSDKNESEQSEQCSSDSIITTQLNLIGTENSEASLDTATTEQIIESADNTEITNTIEGDEISTEDKEKVSDSTTTNRSTLLSDLMEMSGISAEDATPRENVPLPNFQVSPRYLQTAVNATPIITTSPSKNVKELNSITSFVQLKYACEHNGNFFKLDLDNGVITPISVCIKKKQNLSIRPLSIKTVPITPKSVIDLTDEPEEFEPPAFIISKQSQSLLKDTFHLPNSAKPLKIFKSARILKRNRILPNAPPTDYSPDVTDPVVPQTKKRKQCIDTNLENEDSAGSADEYIMENMELWNNRDMSDENSSDDEPLAVKAKRIRYNDNTSETGSSVVNNENNKTTIGDTQETVEKNMDCSEIPAVNNPNDEDIEKSNEFEKNNDTIEVNIDDKNGEDNDEGMREITFLSDHENDTSDDNCILGF